MMEQGKIRVQINCQKAKTVEMELSFNAGSCEADGISAQVLERTINGCQVGRLKLNIENDPMGENANLALEKPVSLYIPLTDRPEKITAMQLFNPWWTRPVFVERFQDIPDQTQAAFFQYADRYACFVPMVGDVFKSYLSGGTDTELRLEMTARVGGQYRLDEPVYAYAEGATVAEAVHRVFAWLAEAKGIRLREERRVPEMFRYLGWCSWDAFYADISEDKLRRKADELREKQVPVRWMLFDDGWLSVANKRLTAFEPDRTKFPDGFKGLTRDIRERGDIQWFGVWYALGGYWNGVHPDSELAVREAANLCRTANGTVVPSPKTGDRFYDDWYRLLRDQGIDFVKVDGQSAVPFYFENTLPVSEAARGINEALERGAYRMDNAIINCMGMAMENILARPMSAISRSSNDFVPKEEGSFSEHLLENAYNSIYQNELYCCDWDMFWTRHEDAAKHSLLRAISGGPVYFSHRIGDTVPEVLKPLAYADGRLLMMDRSAKPTEDCIFIDPMADGVLKLHNVAACGSGRTGGGIAAYNLTKQRQTVAFTPADVPELNEAQRYWVYDFLQKKVRSLGRDERYQDTLEADGFAWYVILPQEGNGSCLGLLDKYAGFSAVESVQEFENTQVIVLHGVPPWKITQSQLRGRVEARIDEVQQTLAVFQVDIRAAEHIVHGNVPGLYIKLLKKLVGLQDILKRKIADAVTPVKPRHVLLVFLPLLLCAALVQPEKFLPAPRLPHRFILLHKLVHPEGFFFAVHLDVQRLALCVEPDAVVEVLKVDMLVPPAAELILLLLAGHILRIVFLHPIQPLF